MTHYPISICRVPSVRGLQAKKRKSGRNQVHLYYPEGEPTVGAWTMRVVCRRTVAVACLSLISSCQGSPAPAWAGEFNLADERLANVVWRVEGGSKTRWPYGIQSVEVNGVVEARQVCLRSMRNHRVRHASHECGLDFLACWSRRWCPPNHEVWLRNVRAILAKHNHHI